MSGKRKSSFRFPKCGAGWMWNEVTKLGLPCHASMYVSTRWRCALPKLMHVAPTYGPVSKLPYTQACTSVNWGFVRVAVVWRNRRQNATT